MTLKRFYFAIPEANVYECIRAHSFVEAKQIAAAEWLPFWDQIEWLHHTEEKHDGQFA
jgi:hypothetical protein